MSKVRLCIASSLLAIAIVTPAFAGTKDGADPKASAEGTANTGTVATPASPTANASAGANVTALLGILVMKGVLAPGEANAIREAGPQAEFQLLVEALARKGVVSAADLVVPAAPAAMVESSPAQAKTDTAQAATKPPAPKVIPAVAPLRVLQLEPSPVNGMIPDIKLGTGAKIKLYGLVKASVIYDSSSPYGTDMPLPGFINQTNAFGSTAFDPGPNGAPEFHAKARFFRLGTSFEWPDASEKNSITGKFEFDFEGNYTRTLNRNISTIRSSQASIRLAYGRIDHRFNDQTSVFALFGQDWTPFGSSTLPAIYETTGLGLGFGTLYERAPLH
jgi:hypothetical protein